jgi:hypothetical protein
MISPRYLVTAWLLAAVAGAASPDRNIRIDALVVTKAELRRHLAAPEGDRFRPATYAELEASRGTAQPDYLVVRFQMTTPGHYFGEAEASIDGNRNGTKLNVVLHFNPGWVEYFIPLDGLAWRSLEFVDAKPRVRRGGPVVAVGWNRLESK